MIFKNVYWLVFITATVLFTYLFTDTTTLPAMGPTKEGASGANQRN